MACIIGSVTLDKIPQYVEWNKSEDVNTEASIAIDGSDIAVSSSIKCYPITLVSKENSGWILGSTVTSLRALSAVVGAYYTLTIGSSTWTVRFRNEQPGGAIQMDTVLPLVSPTATDWWYGTIYLMAQV